MRRRTVTARLRALLLAFLACLLLAFVLPLYLDQRRSDEPFAISSVIASPRDMHVVTTPARLSLAPDLVLNRGVVYAYGGNTAGAEISNIVLDGPLFTLNAAGRPAGTGSSPAGPDPDPVAPLMEQLLSLGFDLVTIRRGTLNITALDGTQETITDIQAEVTGRRKGQIASRGTFTVRGQRLTFDASFGQPTDKRLPSRWPMKASVKGSLLEAAFDGLIDVGEDLQLIGQAEVFTPSLRRTGRWFGLPLQTTDGFNATSVKGELTWARRSLAFQKAKVAVDGNEGNGRLALNLSGERPQVDATLDFASLNLTPYVEAARTQFLGFDIPSASWSLFDISLPVIRHVDADLRVSARKVALKGYALGQVAATITAQSGKLQADITELELNSGLASAQVTAIMSEPMPRYALRGKIEQLDAGPAAALLFGAAAVAGRATLSVDLTSTGYSPVEVLKRLSGKAAVSVPEGRLPLDLKAATQAVRAGEVRGWGALARKGQTGVDQVEVRALIIDGVAFAETLQMRAGTVGLAGSGRVGLADGNMELRLVIKNNVATDRPLKPGDMAGGDVVTMRGPWQEPVLRGEEADPGPLR